MQREIKLLVEGRNAFKHFLSVSVRLTRVRHQTC